MIANRGNPSWVPYWIKAWYCGWRNSPIRNRAGHKFQTLTQIGLRYISPYLHSRSRGKTLGIILAYRLSVFIMLPVGLMQSDSTLKCLHLFISCFSSSLCKQSIASFIVPYSFFSVTDVAYKCITGANSSFWLRSSVSMGAFLWDDLDYKRINDPRSLGSWCIKGTYRPFSRVASSIPLVHHDQSDLGLLILIQMLPKDHTLGS